MTAKMKLLEGICRNPANVRFADACKAAELILFELKSVNGAHHIYKRSNEMTRLNFQKQNDGKIKVYQAQQLIVMIEKYGN